MIRFVKTTGKDPDFILLSNELDRLFLELAGDEKKLAAFNPLNLPVDVEAAVIAYVDGVPAGCMGLKKYDAQSAELKRVFIRKQYRGQKLSTTLLHMTEEEARNRGYRYMLLQTGRVLASSVALYEKEGYRTIPNYGPYAGMKNALCMKKEL